MGFFKIFKEGWTSLSINQRAVYIIIAACSKNMVSHIGREKISKFTGIKDFDAIGKYTKELEEKDWLIREKTSVEKGFAYYYKLVDRGEYEIMSTDILGTDWNPNELALLASLFALRDRKTFVDVTNLWSNTGFPKTSYYRYIKPLISKGYITPASKEEPLTLNQFIPDEILSEDNKCFIDCTLEAEKDYETMGFEHSALYNQIKRLVDTDFEGVGSKNAVVNSLKCGLGVNNRKRKVTNKDIYEKIR